MKRLITSFLLFFIIIMELSGCSEIQAALSQDASRGTWVNNVYSNEFANLKFDNVNYWNSLSNEDIIDKMNLGITYINASYYNNRIIELPIMYDMIIVSGRTESTMVIMFKNLKKTGNLSITENK